MKEPTEIVYLTWLDSSSEHGWTRTAPEEDCLPGVSVGWLLEETALSIVVSMAYACRVKRDDRDDFSTDTPMRIPRTAILRMEKRKPPKWLTWRLPKMPPKIPRK